MKKKESNPWKLRLPDSHTHKVLIFLAIIVVLYLLVSAVT